VNDQSSIVDITPNKDTFSGNLDSEIDDISDLEKSKYKLLPKPVPTPPLTNKKGRPSIFDQIIAEN